MARSVTSRQRLRGPGRPGTAVDAPGVAQAPGRGFEVAAGELEEIRRRGDRPGRRVGDPGPRRRAVGAVDAQPLLGAEPESPVDLGDRGDPRRRQAVLLAEGAPEPLVEKGDPLLRADPDPAARVLEQREHAVAHEPLPRAERDPRLPLPAADPPLGPDPEPVRAVHQQGGHRVGGQAAVRPRAAARRPSSSTQSPLRRSGPEAPPAVERERRDRPARAGPPPASAGQVHSPSRRRLSPRGVPTQIPPSASAASAVTASSVSPLRRSQTTTFSRLHGAPLAARPGRFSPRRRAARARCRRSAQGRGRFRPRGRPPRPRQSSAPGRRDARAARPSRRCAPAARESPAPRRRRASRRGRAAGAPAGTTPSRRATAGTDQVVSKRASPRVVPIQIEPLRSAASARTSSAGNPERAVNQCHS